MNTEFTNLKTSSKWILEKYIQLEEILENSAQNFEFAQSVEAIYSFLWDDYADWFVEYLKTDESQIIFAKELFRQFTITASPYIPFETEALWVEFFGQNELLAFELKDQNWSQNVLVQNMQIDSNKFVQVVEIITQLRSIKGLFGLDPVTRLEIFCDQEWLLDFDKFLKVTAKVDLNIEKKTGLYTFEVEQNHISLDILKYIKDKKAETDRTNKLMENLSKQISALQNQLKNESFLQKADPEIILDKKSDLAQRQKEMEAQKNKLVLIEGLI